MEIFVETEQRLIFRKPAQATSMLCGQCSAPLVFAEEAVHATGLSSRAIHRLVETGELHFAETAAGTLLVCLNSYRGRAAEPGLVRRTPGP